MILVLLSLVLIFVTAFALIKLSKGEYKGVRFFAGVFGFLLMVFAGIGALIYFGTVGYWIAAGQKAQIINREYGTHYTQAEVFYASDVIDTVREINRNRYEINGNLVRDQKETP